ncbi:alpha,alpha-phosphotrehalase [Helcococcus sueciensis]|uniref:alpha,alpha-phosphotrehalase n=1 Tax=Helcococcus sueciensis TaxID=241555 RepID=UPI0003F8589F|nr:alpha,alpha-phosphotrehalase [Helcococcus sueciensis]
MDFKDKVVYQIYIKSFQDTDGDGIGDLKGITKRLPQLKDLGVDIVWITPFFKSPQYDNGYDVADYKSIDPLFGDFDDFDEMMNTAKSLGIEIMLDMVFNHTSTEHEWFQKALSGDKKHQDYYIFKESNDGAPTNWLSKFGGSAWEYVDNLDKWYLHLFHVKQADLNWDNPDLRREIYDVVDFWKSKGVSGFRLDVVNLISKPEIFEDDYEGDGRRFYTDGPNVHKYLKELAREGGFSELITVGEMSSTSIDNCILYSNPDEKELSMVFNFHHLKVDYKDGQKWVLDQIRWDELFGLFDEWQTTMQEHDGWSAWFFNNHDQPRAISRFTDDINYHYESATLIATLTHMMRGTPYIYQGEEIGTSNPRFERIEEYIDVESQNYYNILLDEGKTPKEALHIISERSRDDGRTPVAWEENSPYYGFSTVEPWISFGKVSNFYDRDLNSQKSIYKYYQELIKLRKNHKTISHGKYKKIDSIYQTYAFERIYEDESILVMLNFTEEEMDLEISEEIIKKYNEGEILINNYDDFNIKKLKAYQAIVIRK